MSHDTHVIDGLNKDVSAVPVNTITDAVLMPRSVVQDVSAYERARDFYLRMADGWVDSNPAPVVKVHDGVRVVRDDLIVGTKARGGDLLLSRSNHSTIVYSQPRVGLAGVSILDVAKKYDKKVVLFMPASKRISDHQACCIERGAVPVFKRIASMRNLNAAASKWADENEGFFVPLGLKHPLVTAALVKTASTIPEPETVYVATSTGVLCRALQIAWPRAKFYCVTVARNMKAGELGKGRPIVEPLPFNTAEKPENLPPFPSVNTYDAKVWKFINKDAAKYEDTLMWNVGTEPVLVDKKLADAVNSDAKWDK